jgi:hypothetical protein
MLTTSTTPAATTAAAATAATTPAVATSSDDSAAAAALVMGATAAGATAPGARPTVKPSRADGPGAGSRARVQRRQVVRLAVVLAGVAGLCVASAPARAMAQDNGVVVLAQAESIDQVLSNIRGWLMGILGALATVMATIGGIRYTMADGDPGEVQRAKNAFKSAGIGFALAALAPLLVTVLQGVVGL